ncbi:MAG TPA: 6-phosphogluconolactonase [Longimicrobium sp.]|nr:6-phosphogluconolactonase [Longimicrobium sp.]
MNRAKIEVYPDAHAAARTGAESFVARAREAVEARGRFTVALSGGTGPREMYTLLGTDDFSARIPWEGVHLFWGDDRCVPPHHPRSNHAMAWEAFIRRVPIPPGNVHRILGELPAAEGAARYADELARVFGPGIPRFDLVHLGVGPDAHTCSLFPFAPLLRERERTVAPALNRELGEPRVTFTFPVVNAAARLEMLALGAGKAEVVWKVLRGPLDVFRLPAQNLRPTAGELVWMIDRAAAARLDEGGS